MAGHGPPRTPTAILKARGSVLVARRRETVCAPAQAPACPTHLNARARTEWKAVVTHLHALGVLAQIDRTALIALCQSWADYLDARDAVAKDGQVFKTPQGYIAKNPMVTILNEAYERWRKLAIQFGMTPAARASLPASQICAREADSEREKAGRFIRGAAG